jgi:solute carrier family 50 (sugar transporter)
MIESALMNSTPAWVALCGKLAPMASIALFLAPLPTIRQISKSKTVGNLPLLPHTSMVVNSALWAMYGVLKDEPSVIVANGVGFGLSTLYFREFIKYAPKESSTLPGPVFLHIRAALTAIATALCTAAVFSRDKTAQVIGNAAVLFCMFLFASPLVAIKTVMATRSAESIPLPFTLATVTNCFLWSVVGRKQMKDFVIYFPNLVGLSFGLVQVVLKLIYGNGSATKIEI